MPPWCRPTVWILAATLTAAAPARAAQTSRPVGEPGGRLRLAVAGLVHGHIYGFLYAACGREEIELVGVAESSEELRRRYGQRHQLPASILFDDLETMLDAARPEAVAAFTSTFDHLAVVRACARRGIHVMVEKPLAVSLEHAREMEQAATRGGIHLLTNFETTWYPTTRRAFELAVEQRRLGTLRRIEVHDGHQGPAEIGMPREFLEWLVDPRLNGAGAMYDFGCYGANLATWLMGGARPQRVTAVAQRLKSDPVYARVDDEATIILEYPQVQAVVQASWNWPYSRKDMAICGDLGACTTLDAERYRLRMAGQEEAEERAPRLDPPADDALSYLRAVVRGQAAPDGPSSLAVNMVVSEILDAARRSAETGRTVHLEPGSGCPERPAALESGPQILR